MKQIDMAYFTIGLEKDFYENYYKKYIVNNIVPRDENKQLRKYLNQFYYKYDEKSPCELHVAFTHDEANKAKAERYIKQHFVEKEREK